MAIPQSQREYRKKQRAQLVGIKHKGIVPVDRVSAAELKRLRAEIPDDTRSLTAFLFGDPIPNDRRRAGWVEPVDRRNAIRQERYRERLRERQSA